MHLTFRLTKELQAGRVSLVDRFSIYANVKYTVVSGTTLERASLVARPVFVLLGLLALEVLAVYHVSL